MTSIPLRGWADLIGLPYAELGRSREGVDCWGLVQLAYAELAGIALPSYLDGYVSTAERREIAGLISDAKDSGTWSRVPLRWIEPLDVVVFRRGRFDSHVGLVVEPARCQMLHASGQGVRAETWTADHWRPRLVGFWRHREMGQ